MDNTRLLLSETQFKKNSCNDGCLVHSDIWSVRLTMDKVVATDNWARQTAALVYVETNQLYVNESVYVEITYS